ncbi:hypothetical protein HFP15_39210 [Amycolatopsis sp. K13G38]|uniref:Uncharacterized protein n=1 Tax=Amycolatopsis acididurans TaxID=2724524 RepID=A0ABX1JGH1_9PSEU|nr:hypothetical protein [Amycolatopsis acididurans]NKQ58890.1 hypothetical protein [Amycolatopsis acididurans]
MNDIESAKAAREARKSAVERVASGHTTEELAERAIRRHMLAEELAHEKTRKREEARKREENEKS